MIVRMRSLMVVAFGMVLCVLALHRAATGVRAATDVVITESGCFVLDGAGTVVSGIRSGNEVQIVRHADGTVSGWCSVRVAPPSSDATVEWTHASTGADCALLADGVLLRTANWRQTIAPDGTAELQCSTAPGALTPDPSPAATGEGRPIVSRGRHAHLPRRCPP